MRGGAGVLSGGKYSDNTLKDKINTITDKQQRRKSSPDSDPPGKKNRSMAQISRCHDWIQLCSSATIPALYFICNLLCRRISWPSALRNLVKGQMAQRQSDLLDWVAGERRVLRCPPGVATGSARLVWRRHQSRQFFHLFFFVQRHVDLNDFQCIWLTLDTMRIGPEIYARPSQAVSFSFTNARGRIFSAQTQIYILF